MLQVSGISKRYGDVQILENVSFVVNAGERVGLIGPNGCGKTTLLRIIVGQESADAGSVQTAPEGAKIGYLAQGLEYGRDETVGQVVRAGREGLLEAERELRRLEDALARSEGDDLDRAIAAYSAVQSRFEYLGGYEVSHRISAILDGLGLAQLPLDTPVRILSGGQKTRLGLARLLLEDCQVLLLDEPTNHLDLEALEWLESFLRRYEGAVIMVSHDRSFLNNTASSILELHPQTHQVTPYPGSYADYVAAKERELADQWQRYHEQQEKIAQLEADASRLAGQAIRTEHGTIHYHYRKIAKKTARRAVVQRRRIERMLENEDRVEKPKPVWHMKLDFEDVPSSGQEVLRIRDLAMAFDRSPLFEKVNLTLRQGERIALMGPNGSGKTSLLRIIADELAPTDGQVQLGAHVRLGHYSQEQRNLDPSGTPLSEIHQAGAFSETEARSFLHYFLFAGDEVFLPVADLSYGERARLALAKLVAQGCNLLLLDEPINHLDIPSRESFEQAMSEYDGSLLMVVHDRYFVRRLATGIWALENGTIRSYLDLEDMRRIREERQ